MCQRCNALRTGGNWAAFLKRFKLTEIHDTPEGWTVVSASGHTYHVRSTPRIDRESGGMEFWMSCDCPARKQCRHISAVMDMRYAEELAAAQDGDTDGIEIIERTL